MSGRRYSSNKEAAEQEIERCLVEDREWKTPKLLFANAIKAHMEMFGLDRETSRRVMRDAMEVAD